MPMNLRIEPGDASLDDLVRSTRRGLLVTQFHYTNVIDPLKLLITGMTRNGTYLIEDGEVRHAVKNMRFTDAVPRILSNVTGVGRDVALASTLFGGGFIVPALRVEGFQFSSATEF
jgi:predicted Zn-dependent protease